MNTLTKSEYENEIKELAAGIWEEALSQAEGDSDFSIINMEEAEELAYELAPVWVDDHQWIKDNSYHTDVLAFTENEGSYKDVYCNDDIGVILSEGGLDKLNTIMAYFAMNRDVLEALHEIKED